MAKSKFNKRRCAACIYSRHHSAKDGKVMGIYCSYASIEKTTCLQRQGKDVVDIRGNDYNHCNLYVKKRKEQQNDVEH